VDGYRYHNLVLNLSEYPDLQNMISTSGMIVSIGTLLRLSFSKSASFAESINLGK